MEVPGKPVEDLSEEDVDESRGGKPKSRKGGGVLRKMLGGVGLLGVVGLLVGVGRFQGRVETKISSLESDVLRLEEKVKDQVAFCAILEDMSLRIFSLQCEMDGGVFSFHDFSCSLGSGSRSRRYEKPECVKF